MRDGLVAALCEMMSSACRWLVAWGANRRLTVQLAPGWITDPLQVSAAAIGATPSPVRARMCGLPGASSTTISVPVRTPVAAGEKMTRTRQNPPGARPGPQKLPNRKSPATEMCR
jgi:hypothetical protein